MNLETAYLDGTKIWDCADPDYPIGLTSHSLGSGPEPRASSSPNPSRDGAVNRTRYWGPRMVELVGYVRGATKAARTDTLDALRALFDLDAAHTLRFTPAGSAERQIEVVPAGRFEAPLEGEPPVFAWAIALEAPDPRQYSVAIVEATADPPDDVFVTNAGNTHVPIAVQLNGPFTNLDHLTTPFDSPDGFVKFIPGYDLPAGDTLVIDSATRRVTIDGVDHPEVIDASGTTWLYARPGSNLISYVADSFGAGASISAVIRSGWL